MLAWRYGVEGLKNHRQWQSFAGLLVQRYYVVRGWPTLSSTTTLSTSSIMEDNTSCTSPGNGHFNEEASNGPAFTPTCTGNTFSNAITGITPLRSACHIAGKRDVQRLAGGYDHKSGDQSRHQYDGLVYHRRQHPNPRILAPLLGYYNGGTHDGHQHHHGEVRRHAGRAQPAVLLPVRFCRCAQLGG